MRGRAIVAALSLATVTAVVTIGTIWSAGEARAYCEIDKPCPQPAAAVEADVAALATREWEASAQHFLTRMERGFLQLAGVPVGPY
jgi:hypothetical protein